MKKLILLLITVISLLAEDIVVFKNEYNVLELPKKVTKLLIGNKEMINVSLLSRSTSRKTTLKIFGKKSGNTSILVKYKDGTIVNYHVYVNENLGFIQKMINMIEPTLELSKVGSGSTVIRGTFKDPHNKKRIYAILESAGLDLTKLMDLTETSQVNKMVRTKLYLVQINNQKAKDLGGVTGLGFFSDYLNLNVNPLADNGATFSGWLLDNAGGFTGVKGNSISGTLNFLQTSGIGTILDDTVLMTTEDQNASFRVGGEIYIPTGITQNAGYAPTIQVEEREYGLELSLNSDFLEKEGYIHININIDDSEIDTNTAHNVQLGEGISIPGFVSKTISTNVVVKSKQVIVLGGRLHTEDIESEEKIPFLGDIPLIGELFTHTVSSVQENDLLFFLIPEIIDANDDIDDTSFYKDFKESSLVLHNNILNLDDDEIEEDANLTVADDEVMIIEVEDHKNDLDANKSTELVIEALVEPTDANTTEVIVISPVVSADITPLTEKVELSISPKTSQKYTVTSDKIFLRDKPLTGFRTNVWKKGHEFTSSESKVINGATWLKVKDNCYKGCLPENRELWISKKYVKDI